MKVLEHLDGDPRNNTVSNLEIRTLTGCRWCDECVPICDAEHVDDYLGPRHHVGYSNHFCQRLTLKEEGAK